MSFSITQGIPSTFIIGDAASFQVSDADHPATSWTSTLYFKDSVGAVLSFARTSTIGGDHVFALTNANTLTLIEGKNLVTVVFSDGTHQQTSDWTEVEVLADPTAVSALTSAQQIVASLEAALITLGTHKWAMVNYNGQSRTLRSVKEVREELVYWQARVIQERDRVNSLRGIPVNTQRVGVRFAFNP